MKVLCCIFKKKEKKRKTSFREPTVAGKAFNYDSILLEIAAFAFLMLNTILTHAESAHDTHWMPVIVFQTVYFNSTM